MTNYLSRLAARAFDSSNIIRPKQSPFFASLWSNHDLITEELFQSYPQSEDRAKNEINPLISKSASSKRDSEVSLVEASPILSPSLHDEFEPAIMTTFSERISTGPSAKPQVESVNSEEPSKSLTDRNIESERYEMHPDLPSMIQSADNGAFSSRNRSFLMETKVPDKLERIERAGYKSPIIENRSFGNNVPLNKEDFKEFLLYGADYMGSSLEELWHMANSNKDSIDSLSHSNTSSERGSVPEKNLISHNPKLDENKVNGIKDLDAIEERTAGEDVSYSSLENYEGYASHVNKKDAFAGFHLLEGLGPIHGSKSLNPIIYQTIDPFLSVSQENKEVSLKAKDANILFGAQEGGARSEPLNHDRFKREFMEPLPSKSVRSLLLKEPGRYHISPILRSSSKNKPNIELALYELSGKKAVMPRRTLSEKIREFDDGIYKEMDRPLASNNISEDDFVPGLERSSGYLKADRSDVGFFQSKSLKAYAADLSTDQRANLKSRLPFNLPKSSPSSLNLGPKPEQVQVNIGTVEVRAVTPPRREASSEQPQIMRLDDYLRKRVNGAGE